MFSSSDSSIFLGNRHSEAKPLCQRQDKEPLCEPETTFILQTETKSDAQHCCVDTRSDHNGSILPSMEFSGGSLDVWCCGMIKVIENATNCKSLRLICMRLSCAAGVIRGCIWIQPFEGKRRMLKKCKPAPTLPLAADWHCENKTLDSWRQSSPQTMHTIMK